MKWDGLQFESEVKKRLLQTISNDEFAKAKHMNNSEYTDYIRKNHKNSSLCVPGESDIICTYDKIKIDLKKIINNLGETYITLSWSMAARHIRAWAAEGANKMLNLMQRRTNNEVEEQQTETERELAGEYTALWGSERRIKQIEISKIRPFRTPDGDTQPYKIREWKIKSLIASMEDIGVLQPLIIRLLNNGEDFEYEILAGHHRFFAAQRLNFATVPCEIREGISDELAYKIVAESNPPKMQDRPLPSELAEIYKAYMKQRGTKSEENTAMQIARKFDTSVRTIYRHLKLLELPQSMIAAIDEKKFPFRLFERALEVFTPQQLNGIGEYIAYTNKKIDKSKFELLEKMTDKDVDFDVDTISNFLTSSAQSNDSDENTVPPSELLGGAKIYKTIREAYSDELNGMTDKQIDELILRLISSHFEN